MARALGFGPIGNPHRAFQQWLGKPRHQLASSPAAPVGQAAGDAGAAESVLVAVDARRPHGLDLHIRAPVTRRRDRAGIRSEEHTSELQSLMSISYAVFCLKKKTTKQHNRTQNTEN